MVTVLDWTKQINAEGNADSRTIIGWSQSHATSNINKYTLPPTSNWPPCIFTLVQKGKKSVKQKLCFYKTTKALLKFCKLFHLKMTCTSCIDEVRVMVPSFQKSHSFLNIKYPIETLSVYIFVCLKMLLTTVI